MLEQREDGSAALTAFEFERNLVGHGDRPVSEVDCQRVGARNAPEGRMLYLGGPEIARSEGDALVLPRDEGPSRPTPGPALATSIRVVTPSPEPGPSSRCFHRL